MTNEEAIKVLKDRCRSAMCLDDKEMEAACKLAIAALRRELNLEEPQEQSHAVAYDMRCAFR